MWIVSPIKTGFGKRSLSNPYVNALLFTIEAVRAIPIENVQLNWAILWPKGVVLANSAIAIQTITDKEIGECLSIAKESIESGNALNSLKKIQILSLWIYSQK